VNRAEFEERFSFNNLIDCDSTHWRHALYWATKDTAVAASVAKVKTAYAEASLRASTPIVTDAIPELEGRHEGTPQSRLAGRAQVEAELAKRGWAISEPTVDA
jgi:hypothetical protein